MLTRSGPRVIEFNCRFGDPETEAVLPILNASPSLFDMMRAIGYGERLPSTVSIDSKGCAATTVLASAGYPDSTRTGDQISIPEDLQDVVVFHAGTKMNGDGRLVTSGGRVLAVTGIGSTIELATERSRVAAERIEFAGKQFRTDIGWRELARPRVS
jgi:phosphoribosylamine-glycine ligase